MRANYVEFVIISATFISLSIAIIFLIINVSITKILLPILIWVSQISTNIWFQLKNIPKNPVIFPRIKNYLTMHYITIRLHKVFWQKCESSTSTYHTYNFKMTLKISLVFAHIKNCLTNKALDRLIGKI